jgi:hypothetical protein
MNHGWCHTAVDVLRGSGGEDHPACGQDDLWKITNRESDALIDLVDKCLEQLQKKTKSYSSEFSGFVD